MGVKKEVLVYLSNSHVKAWNFLPFHRDLLEDSVPGLKVTVCQNLKDFLDQLPEAEMVVVWFFKQKWLEKANNLKLIATPAAGKDWIDLGDSKINVWYGAFHGAMIAESIIGAVFYFLKAFQYSKEMQSQKKWTRVKISERLGSLQSSRVTIFGFGSIGQCLGKFLKPYGCTITGIKRTSVGIPDYFTEGDSIVGPDNISEVLGATDHLILSLPGGEKTEGLLTHELLCELPSSCYLYNIGRGNVYEEKDLVTLLQDGRIAGAYLDVFAAEPLSENSLLWQFDNVLITPHTSAISPQYLELFVKELAGRIKSI
jgi:D-2-hydroxyacid dehydrogenase (NADP+)